MKTMKKTYQVPQVKMADYATDEVMGLPAVVSDPVFNGARQATDFEEEEVVNTPVRFNYSVWDD